MPLKSTPITAPACVCVCGRGRARARVRVPDHRPRVHVALTRSMMEEAGTGDVPCPGDGGRTSEDGGAHDVDEVVADEGPVGEGVPPLRAQEKTTINYIDRNTLCSF